MKTWVLMVCVSDSILSLIMKFFLKCVDLNLIFCVRVVVFNFCGVVDFFEKLVKIVGMCVFYFIFGGLRIF